MASSQYHLAVAGGCEAEGFYETELTSDAQQATQLREEQGKLSELETRLQRLEDQIENEVQRLKAESTKRP